jgi:predicted TIM-barrel fold metal-dependent hydrolase
MKGVKLHFSNSGVVLTKPEHLKRVQAVFAEANRLRLPIVVHLTGAENGMPEARIFLDEVLPKAPDVIVPIAHMAAPGRLD